MLTRENLTRSLAVVLALAGGPVLAARGPVIDTELVASQLALPLGVVHAGDGSGRLFILEQEGRVLRHDGTQLFEAPFLDLSSRVSCCGERGLLGLAFHPNYAENGFFYVNYTDAGGDTVVARFEVSDDPNVADADSETEILSFAQPFSNHNGGHLAFGPDGYLYIGSGDGGSGGDPQDNGQSLDTLLGKILRIDVDGGTPYAVPDDNPFVGQAGAMEEIWAYGLRNPWRFSFDRRNGDLYIGDVGQNALEEIDHQPGRSPGGENYGWRIKEGNDCFEPAQGCDDTGLTPPILQYGHSQGCSVTGGFRYRGPSTVTLPRFYVFGDFCSGRIWGARRNSAGNWLRRPLAVLSAAISSFGEDEAGNLYVVGYHSNQGTVVRASGLAIFQSDFEGLDTSDWSRRRGGLQVVSPGLGGSSGALEVPVDGTGQKRFVRSNQPNQEPLLMTAFTLNPNRVELGGGEVEILRLVGRSRHLVLTLEQLARKYRVNLYVAGAGGRLERVGGTKVRANAEIDLALEWSRATGPAAVDGEALLRKNGRVRVRALGLDNHREVVNNVQIGLPAGSAGVDGSGSFLIDDYVSTP